MSLIERARDVYNAGDKFIDQQVTRRAKAVGRAVMVTAPVAAGRAVLKAPGFAIKTINHTIPDAVKTYTPAPIKRVVGTGARYATSGAIIGGVIGTALFGPVGTVPGAKTGAALFGTAASAAAFEKEVRSGN